MDDMNMNCKYQVVKMKDECEHWIDFYLKILQLIFAQNLFKINCIYFFALGIFIPQIFKLTFIPYFNHL